MNKVKQDLLAKPESYFKEWTKELLKESALLQLEKIVQPEEDQEKLIQRLAEEFKQTVSESI